ncbi:hypothetical protein [Nitrosopumilus sp.]|jgi:hypothetical protein|nr:hypothetical protein [Nitrosopumilus sp.]
MKYNCRYCNFKWEGNSDTFDKVLLHEKTHKDKKNQKVSSKNNVIAL